MKWQKSLVLFLFSVFVVFGLNTTDATAEDKIEPVDYGKLKSMMPSSVGGYKMVDDFGGRKSMFGFRISQAEASYEDKKGNELKISIIDFGSVKGIAGKAMLAWMSSEIDNESDAGYEKTTEFKGYKAYEKYSYADKDGKLSVIVAERFLVDVSGTGIDMKDLKKAMGDVNLKKLSKMK